MANQGARFTERSADAAASSVVAGFATLGAVAVNNEIDKLTETIRNKPELIFGIQQITQNQGLQALFSNPNTMMALSSLASDGTLAQLIEDAVSGKQSDSEPSKGVQATKQNRKIRANAKKMKHLRQYSDLIIKPALQKMEPTIFANTFPANIDLLSLVLWATNHSLESPLPSQYLVKGAYSSEVVDFLVSCYALAGNRMANMQLADIGSKTGWFTQCPENPKVVKCSLMEGSRVTFDWATAVMINDPYNLETQITARIDQQKMSISIRESFEEQGVEYPDLVAKKQLEGWEPIPEDDGMSIGAEACSMAHGTSPAAKKSKTAQTQADKASWINNSLRQRLHGKSMPSAGSSSGGAAVTPTKK